MFEGNTLLITGGTGSFGNAVLKHCLKTDIAEIRIFSRDEKKQEDMRNEISDTRVKFFIGDIRDTNSLIFPMRGVSHVFHAAALKQVPSCELFPLEAALTNTIGAENVFNAAIEAGVRNIVTLSTDKAVYPISAMGMSKALMEKIMCAHARMRSGTVFCGTRFGNVIASRGSFIPLFIKQILSDLPITITNPNMTRFMMTMEGAVDIVIYALQNGIPGDIFVKKDLSATVLTVAEALKEIFNADNEIQIIGARYGEKLNEALLTHEEMLRAEDNGNYYRIPLETDDLDYSHYSEGKKNPVVGEYNSDGAGLMGRADIIKLLRSLDCVKEAMKNGKVSIE